MASLHYFHFFIPSSGATLNSHTFSMKNYGLVSITAMLQGVCILDWSLKVSAPQPTKFLNALTTFNLLFFALTLIFKQKEFML